jgi:hypothetical protein
MKCPECQFDNPDEMKHCGNVPTPSQPFIPEKASIGDC